MMTGYVGGRYKPRSKARIYRVVANEGGWSVALGEGRTPPFMDIRQAKRIACELQKQADALSDTYAVSGLPASYSRKGFS